MDDIVNIDKFSLPLRNGFNALNQVSQVHQNSAGNLHATIAYFNLDRDEAGKPKIGAYGFRVIAEDEVEQYKTAYSRSPADKAALSMLQQLETAFAQVHSGESTLEQLNQTLRQKTEAFYQYYIAGETITQTYNPLFPHFITPESDDFNTRRMLQRVNENVGKDVKIDPQRIRNAWGLDEPIV